MFPKLHAEYTAKINSAGDQFSGPYKLDEPSFCTFSEAIMEDRHRRAGLLESHLSGGDDVVEELASGVFEDEDDVGGCGDDFVSVWFLNIRYSVNDSAAGKALDEQFDDMWVP